MLVDWTPELTARIGKMRDQGLSAGQIAEALNREGIVASRNAVIGKLARACQPGEWTAEQIAILRKHHPDVKVSYRQIGAMVGKNVNAVKAMASRLKLPKRQKSAAMKAHHARKGHRPYKPQGGLYTASHPPRPYTPARTTMPVPDPLEIDLMALTDKTCKWPVTEKSPHRFCGHKTFTDSPYCEAHHAIGRVPAHR